MKDKELKMEYLPYVMHAYSQAGKKLDGQTELHNLLESYALENFLEMTAEQACYLIIMNGENIEDAELVEICEKKIAAEIDKL